jgi:hypothetical protein
MTDSRFAAFEPRRHTQSSSVPAETHDAEHALALEQPSVVDTVVGQASLAPTEEAACERCATRSCDDDGIDPRLIRAAAIPLAAAACARALRYAIDRNPRLIIRFVDDALAAAGAAARRATIRVTPDHVGAFGPERAQTVAGDEALGPGDVFIDTPAGAIGAHLGDRADLLVRAAAR